MPQTVSFGNLGVPNDYQSEAIAIERRRKLAEALQQQSQTPLDVGQSAGGWAIPISPFQGLAKIAQAGTAAYGQKKATEEEKALSQRYQDDLAKTLTNAMQAQTGTPARPAALDPQEIEQSADQGTPLQTTMPAVAGSRDKMIQALMMHPATQPLAMAQMQADLQRQAFMSAGGMPTGQPAPAGAPQGNVATSSGAPAPSSQPASPQQMPGFGGPAGGQPMAVWLQTDPSGKGYVEQLAKDREAMMKPTRFTAGGGVVMGNGQVLISAPDASGRVTTYGQNGPTQSMVPGAAATTTEQANIPKPGAPMMTIKASNQRELSLTQPEYLAYTNSGGKVLPSRYQSLSGELPGVQFQDAGKPAQPNQPNTPPMQIPPQVQAQRDQEAALIRAREGQPNGGGAIPTSAVVQGSKPPETAVLGATQSQGEQIEQARQTAGGKAIDEAFAKDYVPFVNGGAQDATKQLAQLKDVSTALQAPNAKLTGPVLGSMPDAALKFTNPQAIAMRERVEEVVQRSLRAILGAQFTEKEGERLIARAYNPNLPESENSIRVNRLYEQLNQAYQNKQDAARFFAQNGTLQGWQGRLPNINDFNPEKAGATSSWAGNAAVDEALKKYGR